MVHSAQFQQALRAFNSALQSGALAEVLPALGLPPSAAAGDVQEFLRALQVRNPHTASKKGRARLILFLFIKGTLTERRRQPK